ncbi:MAG: IS200/IS605 family transposase, partial [Christensenellaceae bacterium]
MPVVESFSFMHSCTIQKALCAKLYVRLWATHRKIIYGALRAEIGKILRELCERKEVEIIEAHAMPNHIHKLVSIPPNEKVSSFMGYLKGRSTMIIFERYAHMKYKLGNRHVWSRGYYVSTVGNNKQAVQKYIQNQEKEHLISDQISM